jgi:4-hydroxybenzoate polyprenyltransferase
MHLLLWIFVAYAFFTYMPDFVKFIILLVGLVVLWVTWLLCLSDYSKRNMKSYAVPHSRLSFILGLFCYVVWNITGEDIWGVWGRLATACIFVSAVYTVVYRVIDRRRDFET